MFIWFFFFIIAIHFVILVVDVVERVVQVCFVILFCLIFFVVGYTILIFPLVPGSWFRVFEVLEFILVPISRSLATAPLFFVLPFVLMVVVISPYRWHVGLLTVLVSICNLVSIQFFQVPYRIVAKFPGAYCAVFPILALAAVMAFLGAALAY